MKTLFIASANKHKCDELQSLLKEAHFKIFGIEKLKNYLSPEETGKIFLENAQIKARALKVFLETRLAPEKLSELYILADDSGLVCDDLNGQPGVYSARFAGVHATDAENNKKLVEMFSEVSHWSRTARYVCALVLIKPDDSEISIEEKCEGHIVLVPKGVGGFGYDPYFYLEDFNKTMAELTSEEKNRVSHRGKALRKLLDIISA